MIRPLRELIRDLEADPTPWEVVRAETEPSTNTRNKVARAFKNWCDIVRPAKRSFGTRSCDPMVCRSTIHISAAIGNRGGRHAYPQ